MDKIVFLVAVPNGVLYHCCKKIQQWLWEKYHLLQEEFPEIHLTIDAFYYETEEELKDIQGALDNLVKNIEPLEIRVNGFGYIPHPYNCVTLHVVKTAELKQLYHKIHEGMIKKGYKVRNFTSDEVVFHISLAGTHGREWSEAEALGAWEKVRNFSFREVSYIEELKLWHPHIQEQKRWIRDFKL